MTTRSIPGRPGTHLSSVFRGSLLAGALALAFFALPGAAEAQLATASQSSTQTALRVFLDCQGQVPCNRNHFRTEIQWINWMNDRTDADVHVIITSEQVGGGGRRFTMDFMGRNGMSDRTDALTYTSSGTDVMIETLDGITQGLRLGLMRFAVEAGLGNDFEVAFNRELNFSEAGGDAASGDASEVAATYDPWNYWTFRVGLSGNMSIQENRSSHRFNPSVNADRVTEAWKLNFGASANMNREKIELTNRTVRNDRDSWNMNTLVVRSLTSNMSTGFDLRGGSSPQNNRNARITFTPALEWNYYPYDQANRRQLIAHYGAGVQYNSYAEMTVFEVMQETVPMHKLGIQYRAVEGWGNAGISLDASQYLHSEGLYSFGASGNLSFRVARGLELSLNLSGSRIADQIHIPAGDISDEDVLLGRQALPTGYNYQGSVGFNYRWGSSFSNIVNVRFPPSVR